MAYDIYGNNLKPGYCEVHPHVGEEYPCWICCKEIEQENERQRMNRQFQEAQNKDFEKAIQEQYESSFKNESVDKVFEIDFEGHVLAKIKVVNNEIEVLASINGYGNKVTSSIKQIPE